MSNRMMLMNINRRVNLDSTSRHSPTYSAQASELEGSPPRFVLRNLPFHQSQNSLNIRLHGLAKYAGKIVLMEDWYHVLLRLDTRVSSLLMLTAWTIAILIFGAFYLLVDYLYLNIDCGLVNPNDNRRFLHYGAYFAFSLQTTTTVGYTLPNGINGFFENCPGLQAVIYFQMIWSMMFNAFLFAFFYARLAKVESRAAQVIFSKTAILSRRTHTTSPSSCGNNQSRNGHQDDNTSDVLPWTFSFRVADVDAGYPIVEAHVRLYAKVGQQLIEMRILSPNDVLGACLFLSWPTTIVHEVDIHSPLHPMAGSSDEFWKIHPFLQPDAGINIRHAEAAAGESERYGCPVCGEGYGSLERLRNHVRFTQQTEANDKMPREGTHLELSVEDICAPAAPKLDEILEWFPDEIIAVVEGVDPLTSGTFQALQSYSIDDLSFGGEFASCCSKPKKVEPNTIWSKIMHKDSTGRMVLDLDKFHCVVHDDVEEIAFQEVDMQDGHSSKEVKDS